MFELQRNDGVGRQAQVQRRTGRDIAGAVCQICRGEAPKGAVMLEISRLILATLGAVVLVALDSIPALPQVGQNFQTLTYRATATGPTLILAKWTCWFGSDQDCKYAPCHMTTVQEPKLGKLRPAVSPGVIPANGGVCAGRPVPVLNITYTPKPGAHGSDEVVLESRSENYSRHMIHIYVEVP
jgi:hypothetical protein